MDSVLLQVLHAFVRIMQENVMAKLAILFVRMVSGVHPNLVNLVKNAKTQVDSVLFQVLHV